MRKFGFINLNIIYDIFGGLFYNGLGCGKWRGVGTLPIAIRTVGLVGFYLVSKIALFTGLPAICS